MAQGTYKVDEAINLVYQAAAVLSDASCVATVYDEGDVLNASVGSQLTITLNAGELSTLAEGRYQGNFTPDAEGRWTVIIQASNGGEVSKVYNVTAHNVDSIGDDVAGLGAGQISSQIILNNSALAASGGVSGAIQVIDNEIATIDTEISEAESILLTQIAAVAALATSGAAAATVSAAAAANAVLISEAESILLTTLAALTSPGMIS